MKTEIKNEKANKYAVTRNACKLCTPLGACLAFRGIEKTMSLLHGSQGCSTYIRRYMISHYKEPIDIASSNFSEDTAIYGGDSNLKESMTNVISQYEPEVLAIATTCLSETIGDDVNRIIREYREENENLKGIEIVNVSTPSYKGTHADGYRSAVKALVKTLSGVKDGVKRNEQIVLIPGMFSTADIRHLKEIVEAFEVPCLVLPDYSDSLEGGLWNEYEKIPAGGTPIDAIKNIGNSNAVIEFTKVDAHDPASDHLLDKFGVEQHVMEYPIGIEATDKFIKKLCEITGKEIPESISKERGRLLDSLVDSHKHAFGVNALVFGEEDLALGLSAFLAEIGIVPKLIASGGRSKQLKEAAKGYVEEFGSVVLDGVDFEEIKESVEEYGIDLMLGNSKGYKISRALDIPLVRVGFPIHDRVGGQRVLHVGYRGAQNLFDTVLNTILERKQDKSSVGYTYL